MKYLAGTMAEFAEHYCNHAAVHAGMSNCRKSQNGSVIVREGEVIATGWNTPVPDKPCDPCRRVGIGGRGIHLELCNAIHAEHNAVLDAYRSGHTDLTGAVLYHAKLKAGEVKIASGPSCTSCSRLILHAGLEGVVLIQEEGYVYYSSDEFNRLSFRFHEGS